MVLCCPSSSRKGSEFEENEGKSLKSPDTRKSVFHIKMPWGQTPISKSQIEVKVADTKKLVIETFPPLESSKGSNLNTSSMMEEGSEVVTGSLTIGKSKKDEVKVEPSTPLPKKEKDKSSKRKSNLNRALTEEAVPITDYFNNGYTPVGRSRTSSRPLSQEFSSSSMEENLLKDTGGTSVSSTIIKPPQIPPIFQSTENKLETFPSSSSNISNKSSKILNGVNNKIKVFEGDESKSKSSHDTSIEKRDSFSDAEGMTCIKRLLQRESNAKKNQSFNPKPVENSASSTNLLKKPKEPLSTYNANGGLRKSSSSGNAFNCLSKFSDNQPSFLKKFFETKNESKENSIIPASSKTNDEDPLTLNVAQKANFFMKLEHDQRFSKWRKDFSSPPHETAMMSLNESRQVDVDSPPLQNKSGSIGNRGKSRFSTQPIRAEEVEAAATHHNFLAGLGKCWDNSGVKGKSNNGDNKSTGYDNFSYGIQNAEVVEEMPWGSGSKSSYTDRDDTFPPQMSKSLGLYDNVDSSKLSLKERVNMFDRIRASSRTVTTGIGIQSSELSSSSSRPPSSKSKVFSSGSFPSTTVMMPGKFPTFPVTSSSSSTLLCQTPVKNMDPHIQYQSRNPSRCQSQQRRSVFEEFSTPLGFYDPSFDRDRDLFSPLSSAKRRGSTSDVEMKQFFQETTMSQDEPGVGHYSNLESISHSVTTQSQPQPPFYPPMRNHRVKSMFLTRGGSDTEDGEVSSGGLEVAEIISRSYENSPIARKKSWRSQKKAQQNFTKEIWRKCMQHDEYMDGNNEIFYDAKSEFEDCKIEKYETGPPPPAIPPPATSNLLHILTALSSSNDELDETKPVSNQNQRLRSVADSSSDGTKTPIRNQNRKVTVVNVPHPDDDESFRKFFNNRNFNFPPICPTSTLHPHHHLPPRKNICDQNTKHQQQFKSNNTTGTELNAHRPANIDFSSDKKTETTTMTTTEEFSSVKRESELLVMKKHMPLVRRKSSGKNKNPLKALAMRMDFRNQKYSEVHVVSNKGQDESN